MKILNIALNYQISRNQQVLKKQKNNQNSQAISFKSIFPDAHADNQGIYALYTISDPEFSELKKCSTRIFRELPSQLAIARLLKPEEKSEIKILGSSDGSEAWAYAIAAKEAMGEKAKENVVVNGVDIAPYMVAMAKTGKIVCSDVEKKYADRTSDSPGGKSPLKGSGWDKYLKQSSEPSDYPNLLKQYPCLKYLKCDPVANKTIGKGFDWYEVNKEIIPSVTFKQGDMLENLTPDKDSQAVVYVVANSAGYLLERSARSYISLFEKIKEENKDSERKVYVVIGDVELKATSDFGTKHMGLKQKELDQIRRALKQLGYENISQKKVRKLGVEKYDIASSKIYVLNDN